MRLRRATILALLVFGTCASAAWAQAPVTPASPSLSPGITWDSAPHTFSTARNFETAYALYGRGVDGLFGKTGLDRGAKGVIARLAKSPLDAYVAWLATLGGHEFGHCQQAWLAGSHDCHWIAAPGPYALGHIISVGDAGHLSPAGRMAVTAGGTQASVTAADALKREMIADGDSGWTSSTLLAFRQLDLTLYGLTAPSPANAGPLDYANDMTNYAARYGSRSGLGGEAIHTDIVRGAWWNAGDPVTWYAIASYFHDYVVRGRRTAPTTGIRMVGREWMAMTSAWLSEVGVRYSLGVFSRAPGGGNLVELTPSWGEGQPAVNARWSTHIRPTLRVGVSVDAWRQRASAEPGPLESGGSIGVFGSRPFARLTISGDLGYKSAGVMLGRPQDAGWFFSIGTAIRVR